MGGLKPEGCPSLQVREVLLIAHGAGAKALQSLHHHAAAAAAPRNSASPTHVPSLAARCWRGGRPHARPPCV